MTTHEDRFDVVVVGGGISGLATAYWLRELRPDLRLVVLEAESTSGGHVRSSVEAGFTIDWGPTALRAGAPDTTALLSSLGLEGAVLPAAAEAKRRYVVRGGRLQPLPGSPLAVLRSKLLSPAGKARALLEPFIREPFIRAEEPGDAPADDGRVGEESLADESVTDLLRRRFGAEVAGRFGEVLVGGLVAGDPAKLSAAALFPRIVALERQHGSVLRGFMAAARARSKDRSPSHRGSPGGSRATREGSGSPGLYTLRGGLGALTSALVAELTRSSAVQVRTATTVRAVSRRAGGYEVVVANGEPLVGRRIVLATPAPVSAALVNGFAPAAAAELLGIEYVDVGVTTLGFEREALVRALDGFGLLAPRGQGVRSLGVQFVSSTFPTQAPDSKVLVRAIAGGAFNAEFLGLTDAEAVAVVREDLRTTLGITAAPVFVHHKRSRGAIPQYELGHRARLESLARLLPEEAGLYLAGNGYRGVGVNDCLREARGLAERLAAAPASG